jgi:hypothetical protein
MSRSQVKKYEMLYCKNVSCNDEDSAHIFYFLHMESYVKRYLEAEEQMNIVSIDNSSSDLAKKFTIGSNCHYEKYRMKNVLKSVMIVSNGCGRDFSANKLCIYIYVPFTALISGEESIPVDYLEEE